MSKDNFSIVTCEEVEERLKIGEIWTRAKWLNEPIFKGRNPRILILREHSAWMHEEGKYQDHFKQVWDGLVNEPALNMIRYRPSTEDWEATDWIKVDPK